MKPSWNDAPEWAQWLAMDEDGEWFWFESEPQLEGGSWFSQRYLFAGFFVPPALEPRP